ncbi:aldo/keto reductase [Chloroflexota bacterium]
MNFRRLGSTGLLVSEVGLGGNNFGWWTDEETSIPVINHAISSGINFIDTADMYDNGNSEKIIGKAVKGKRAEVIIATKFSSTMGDGPNDRGGSRYYIMKAVEASLKRLQTDYIDLYQMHFKFNNTPIEETLRALDDLVKSGKVRYIGCSNYAAWELAEALWTSRANNLHSFATIQPKYNLIERGIEAELIPCCEAYGIGVIPYSPLAGGFLTGKYQKGKETSTDGRLTKPSPRDGSLTANVAGARRFERLTTEDWNKLAKWEAFAKERNRTVGELAIAWLLSKVVISTVIAGARKIEQVTANIAGSDWKLTKEEVDEIEAVTGE